MKNSKMDLLEVNDYDMVALSNTELVNISGGGFWYEAGRLAHKAYDEVKSWFN